MSDSEPSDNSLSRSPALSRSLDLVLRNLLFTVIAPSFGDVWMPWRILTRGYVTPKPVERTAVAFIVIGFTSFLCLGFCDSR